MLVTIVDTGGLTTGVDESSKEVFTSCGEPDGHVVCFGQCSCNSCCGSDGS
jgi:hypothetical protein